MGTSQDITNNRIQRIYQCFNRIYQVLGITSQRAFLLRSHSSSITHIIEIINSISIIATITIQGIIVIQIMLEAMVVVAMVISIQAKTSKAKTTTINSIIIITIPTLRIRLHRSIGINSLMDNMVKVLLNYHNSSNSITKVTLISSPTPAAIPIILNLIMSTLMDKIIIIQEIKYLQTEIWNRDNISKDQSSSMRMNSKIPCAKRAWKAR